MTEAASVTGVTGCDALSGSAPHPRARTHEGNGETRHNPSHPVTGAIPGAAAGEVHGLGFRQTEGPEPERAADPNLCPPVAPCDASASLGAASPAKPASRRNGLRYLEAMIAWTPRSEAEGHRSTVGQVKVGPWPDRTGWSDAFACHGGGAEVTEHLPSKARVTAMVLQDFHTLVCRDGMRPRVVHEALLAISEYRRAIDPDIPGARGPGRDRSSIAATRPW